MIEVDGVKLPKITLFTNNKDEAVKNFSKLEEERTSDVGKLLRRLIKRKYVSLADAAVLINKPQTGAITSPFRRAKGPSKKDDEQQQKKTKTDDASGNLKGVSISGTKVKYSLENEFATRMLSGFVNKNQLKLITAAYSHSSWTSMECAVKNLCLFKGNSTVKISLTEDSLSDFIWWCFNTKKLKYSSILSYVSSIRTLSDLQGNDTKLLYSNKVKSVLKGVRNMDETVSLCAAKRLAFSYPLLKLLGNSLLDSNWSEDELRIFWTLCCLLFFGSFRIGELLSFSEKKFDSLTTLLWGDVLCLKNSVRLFIRFPKIFSPGGITVDLFEFEDDSCCPVSTLKNLKKFKNIKESDMGKPVFMYNNGKLLTPAKFNSDLRSSLSLVLGEKSNLFSSHSFRAAIPTVLASHPDLANDSDLMNWGRWNSDCYKRYTKLKINQRKVTFTKICDILSNQASL